MRNIKNAIVLVEQIDLEAKTGKKPLDAVVSATTSRIVPVAMASIPDSASTVYYVSTHHG